MRCVGGCRPNADRGRSETYPYQLRSFAIEQLGVKNGRLLRSLVSLLGGQRQQLLNARQHVSRIGMQPFLNQSAVIKLLDAQRD